MNPFKAYEGSIKENWFKKKKKKKKKGGYWLIHPGTQVLRTEASRIKGVTYFW